MRRSFKVKTKTASLSICVCACAYIILIVALKAEQDAHHLTSNFLTQHQRLQCCSALGLFTPETHTKHKLVLIKVHR